MRHSTRYLVPDPELVPYPMAGCVGCLALAVNSVQKGRSGGVVRIMGGFSSPEDGCLRERLFTKNTRLEKNVPPDAQSAVQLILNYRSSWCVLCASKGGRCQQDRTREHGGVHEASGVGPRGGQRGGAVYHRIVRRVLIMAFAYFGCREMKMLDCEEKRLCNSFAFWLLPQNLARLPPLLLLLWVILITMD